LISFKNKEKDNKFDIKPEEVKDVDSREECNIVPERNDFINEEPDPISSEIIAGPSKETRKENPLKMKKAIPKLKL
jgi:hypothetical protein